MPLKKKDQLIAEFDTAVVNYNNLWNNNLAPREAALEKIVKLATSLFRYDMTNSRFNEWNPIYVSVKEMLEKERMEKERMEKERLEKERLEKRVVETVAKEKGTASWKTTYTSEDGWTTQLSRGAARRKPDPQPLENFSERTKFTPGN